MQLNNVFPMQIPAENSIFGHGPGYCDSLNILPYSATNKIKNNGRDINSNIFRLNPNAKMLVSEAVKNKNNAVVPQLKKFNNDEEIKSGFNDYVAQSIDNHKEKPLFETKDSNFAVDGKWYLYNQPDAVVLVCTNILKTLWNNFIKKNNIQSSKQDKSKLDIAGEECILSNGNKEKLEKLLTDSKVKAQEE